MVVCECVCTSECCAMCVCVCVCEGSTSNLYHYTGVNPICTVSFYLYMHAVYMVYEVSVPALRFSTQPPSSTNIFIGRHAFYVPPIQSSFPFRFQQKLQTDFRKWAFNERASFRIAFDKMLPDACQRTFEIIALNSRFQAKKNYFISSVMNQQITIFFQHFIVEI